VENDASTTAESSVNCAICELCCTHELKNYFFVFFSKFLCCICQCYSVYIYPAYYMLCLRKHVLPYRCSPLHSVINSCQTRPLHVAKSLCFNPAVTFNFVLLLLLVVCWHSRACNIPSLGTNLVELVRPGVTMEKKPD